MKLAGGLSLAGAAVMLVLSTPVSHAEGAAQETPKAPAKAPAADDFVTRLFGGPVSPAKKTYACFTRAYDPEHLAEHPQQKVNLMKLLLTAEKVPEDPEMNYSFRLGVKYRNKSANYDSSGDCGVDCDGGGIDVLLAKDDKSAIVKLQRIRMWRNNNYDEDAERELVAGVDDKEFRLDRAALKDCESLVTDRKELAAMRRK